MVVNVCCKFVSQKINKIRWRPVATDITLKPDTFVCGGWQNEPDTSLTIWRAPELAEIKQINNISRVSSNNSMVGDEPDPDKIIDPKLIQEIPHDGDVTDIKYLNKDLFAVSSSTGTVALFKHCANQTTQLEISWDKSHNYLNESAPCTGIDTYGENIVSVGEDGRLIQYNLKHRLPVRIIDADCCSITSVAYIKHNEVVTCNSQGQLNVWDLRKPGEPAKLLLMSGDQSAILSLARHPTLPNVLACGSADGTLVIWDLKQEKYPETLLSAHKGPIFELKFHPQSPNHLFTCSMDGAIWHWDSSALDQNTLLQHTTSLKSKNEKQVSTPWLLWNASKQNLDICSLIPSSTKPINSLDILQDILLCGSDNEAFYTLTDLHC
ncbi:Nucleoporin Nup43 [Chamberlinius hualienensis]